MTSQAGSDARARRAAWCIALLTMVCVLAWCVDGDPGALVGASLQRPLSMVTTVPSVAGGSTHAGGNPLRREDEASAPAAASSPRLAARRAWLGTDPLGRDVFVRVAHGARISILLATTATVVALALGALLGAIAGAGRGIVDTVVMRISEVVMVLPALYVLLAVRASLPLVIEPSTLFGVTALVLGVLGTPFVARATRAVIVSERSRDFVLAAIGNGAGWGRIVVRHLIPQTWSVVAAQALVLFPAFLLAEATMSFAGLGFPADKPSWGTLLQDAASVRVLDSAPWLLAPVVAMALTVWVVNLAAGE